MRFPRALATAALVAVVLVAALPGLSAGPGGAIARFPTSVPPGLLTTSGGSGGGGVTTVPGNLSLANSSFSLSPTFWGTTISPRASLLPNEAEILVAAHVHTLVWPGAGAGEDYNPLNDTLLTIANGTPVWRTASTSEAEFAALCRSIACTAILQVPGEIDRPAFAAKVVSYTEQVLRLNVSCWEIGNEPEYWSHWNVSWPRWGASPTSFVTPMQYAWEVANYTKAMRAVDPSTHVIGLPGTGRPHDGLSLSDWINATISVNGPNLSGIAFHSYPAGTSPGTTTLVDFYASLLSNDGVAYRVKSARATIANDLARECPGCAPIPVDITEVGSALSHGVYGNYSEGFPGALDLAGLLVQAIDANVTNVDLFATVMNTSNSWFDFAGQVRPDYAVYSDLLSHLGSTIDPATWSSGTPNGQGSPSALGSSLFAVATTDPTDQNRTDLLVINLNLTTSAEFTPVLPGISTAVPTEVWQWSGALSPANVPGGETVVPLSAAPVPTFLPSGLPSSWVVRAQSITLFEAYPRGGAPVTVPAAGLPSGERWFVASDHRVATSTEGSMTLYEPMGPTSVAPVPIPYPGENGSTRTRLGAVSPAPFSLNGPTTLGVAYARQWWLNLTPASPDEGTVLPGPGWWSENQSVTLSAVAAPGFSFDRWEGFGPGSRNSSAPVIEVWVNGSMSERAVFVPAAPVRFVELGLPADTVWGVTILGQTESAFTDTIWFNETNRTIGYSVIVPPAFRATPANGSITVVGLPVIVPVNFTALHPPPPRYSVTFIETGLPGASTWSVDVRNASLTSSNATISVWLSNGSYGYQVGTFPGYRVTPPRDGFWVNGTALRIAIVFFPPRTNYPVTWHAQGLWQGAAWWVSVDAGPKTVAASASISLNLSVGAHEFSTGSPAGFRPMARAGTIVISDAGFVVLVRFAPVDYPVLLTAQGLPPGLAWEVRLGALQQTLARSTISFAQPNGTYTFDIASPPGFYPVPSHGNLTVFQGPTQLVVSFLPVRPVPPSVWVLGGEALAAATMMAIGIASVRWGIRSRRSRDRGDGPARAR